MTKSGKGFLEDAIRAKQKNGLMGANLKGDKTVLNDKSKNGALNQKDAD